MVYLFNTIDHIQSVSWKSHSGSLDKNQPDPEGDDAEDWPAYLVSGLHGRI